MRDLLFSIGYSMFCVGYGIYTREWSSRLYSTCRNQHKKLYHQFSPSPAVSCVADMPVSHLEIKYYFAFYCISFRSLSFLFKPWMRSDGRIGLNYFSKLSGKHYAAHTLQMYMLISPHCLCTLTYCANSGDSHRSA